MIFNVIVNNVPTHFYNALCAKVEKFYFSTNKQVWFGEGIISYGQATLVIHNWSDNPIYLDYLCIYEHVVFGKYKRSFGSEYPFSPISRV